MGELAFVTVAVMLMHLASAQNTSTNCTVTEVSAALQPCLMYLTNMSRPDNACCNPILNLSTSNPTCICQLSQQIPPGDVVNMTRITEIVQDCNVNVGALPCNLFGAPASSPLPISFTAALQSGNIFTQLSMILCFFVLLFLV